MIIRAWIENGSSSPLRVHLRINNDLTLPVYKELNLDNADDVVEQVKTWLSAIEHEAT